MNNCACARQIEEFMKVTGSQKAVVWRSPFQLWANCDWLLYTHGPETFMKFYPHKSRIEDTDGGMDLTACPASIYPSTLQLDSSWSTELIKPYYRYVDGIKSHESGFKHPGDVRYMYIRKKFKQ
jgi:hypothetical protein